MTDSPDRFPWEHDDSLLGPAVPQEDATHADDALPEPLSPFMGGDTPISTNADPAFEAEDEPTVEPQDIPWLEDLQPESTAAAFDGPPTMPADSVPELPTMDAFLASADDEPTSAGRESGFEPGADGLARSAGDVADRLERIAGVLRSGDPSRLLADASDPLEMLILGYVLGCSNSGRADR